MEANIGAFEAHGESMMRELWKQVLPYFNKNHDYGTREDKIFYSLCNFLEENQNHWVWDKVDSDSLLNPEEYFKILSKELLDESLILDKKITDERGRVVGVEQVKIKKPKYEYPKWIKNRSVKTSNGILVRYTDKREISIKGFTEGLIMSTADYTKFKEALTLDLTTLTLPHLHQLIVDIKSDPNDPFWTRFPTLRTFYEDLLTELGESPVNGKKTKSNKTYQIGKGFNNKQPKQSDSDTIDVFNGI